MAFSYIDWGDGTQIEFEPGDIIEWEARDSSEPVIPSEFSEGPGMTIRVMTANSTSANHHVYVTHGAIPTSVSTGLSNSQTLTFRIPIESRDARITINGTFGSGSASSNMVVDIGPGRSGLFFFPLFSTSVAMTTTIPLQVDHVLRFRHALTSAAAGIGASVDVWVG